MLNKHIARLVIVHAFAQFGRSHMQFRDID